MNRSPKAAPSQMSIVIREGGVDQIVRTTSCARARSPVMVGWEQIIAAALRRPAHRQFLKGDLSAFPIPTSTCGSEASPAACGTHPLRRATPGCSPPASAMCRSAARKARRADDPPSKSAVRLTAGSNPFGHGSLRCLGRNRLGNEFLPDLNGFAMSAITSARKSNRWIAPSIELSDCIGQMHSCKGSVLYLIRRRISSFFLSRIFGVLARLEWPRNTSIYEMKCLCIPFESTGVSHTLVKRSFANMPEGRMTQIVCQPCEFDQIGIDRVLTEKCLCVVQSNCDGLGDLSHFHRMCEPISEKVRLIAREYLSLAL